MTYNPGQKSLGHCTFKQGNAITLERQTLGRFDQDLTRFDLPQPMLKSTGSILASRSQHCFGRGGGEGRGGEGWTVRCFVPLVHLCIGKYQSVPRLLAMIVVYLKINNKVKILARLDMPPPPPPPPPPPSPRLWTEQNVLRKTTKITIWAHSGRLHLNGHSLGNSVYVTATARCQLQFM